MQPSLPPSHPSRIVLQTLTIALFLLAVTMLASARASAQEPAYRLASGDLGVAPGLVTATTTILSPDGTAAGPSGVEAFVESLRSDHPDAKFDTAEIHVIGELMIVDWQGTIDDTVVVYGRTIITVDEGRITRLAFLNLSDIAPVAGEPARFQ